MALNELIAQGAQFAPAPDPFKQYAVMQQLQQGQQQNALNQLKMQEAQRAFEEQNQMRALYKGVTDMQDPSLAGRVAGINPAAGWAVTKAQQDAMKVKADALKTGADAVGTALKNSRTALDGITTPEQYMQWHLANHSDPVLGSWLKERGSTPEQSLKRIQQAIQEGRFPQLLNESKIGAEKALENHFVNRDNGQTIDTLQMPKYGGGPAVVVQGSAATKVADPNAQLQAGVSRANNRDTIAQADRSLDQRKEVEKRIAANAGVELAPKEIQKREANYPTATAAIKGFEVNADNFAKDLQALRDHPGLGSITGIAAGRLPGITDQGRAAKALYDKIMAKGGFQVLQDIRAASKTGGGLGAVSNQEGTQLKAAFAAIDRTQEAADIKKALDAAISDLNGSKSRMREAYDTTYEYKASKQSANPIDALLDKYK